MALQIYIHCSPNWRVLETAAIKVWKDGDGKKLVIVPSAMLRDWWLSRLAEECGGVHGEVVVTLEKLAEQLAQRNAQTLFRLAHPLELRLAAWDALYECNVPEQWRVSGVVDAFLDAVKELELHDLKPEDVAQALAYDRNINLLTELWKYWRKSLNGRNLWTVGDVLRQGIEAAQHLQGELCSEVIAYGFTGLTDLRWKFLQALRGIGVKTMRFFVPTLASNQQAYCYTQNLFNLLKPQGAKICEISDDGLPSELKCIPQLAFCWQRERKTKQKRKTKQDDRIVCIAAAGEEQEIEMAIRVLTQWAREGKLKRYSDALLMVRSIDKYLPALEAMSARYGIPYVLLSESGQPAHGLQQLLSAFAEAKRRGFDGELLWQILPSPYLQVDGKPLLPVERHEETLKRIRENIAETDTQYWVGELGFDGRFSQKLGEFFEAVSNLPLEASAGEHARSWRKLLDMFVAPVNGDEKEKEALSHLRSVLNSLMAWEKTGLQLSEIVKMLIDACRFKATIHQDAIRVVSVTDGRGIWSPAIVILGLNDDEFPQISSRFKLLTDEHRMKLQQIFKLLTPLESRSQLLASERMLFMEAIGSATERLVVTYKRTDSEGKPQAASVFLSAIENALLASGWRWRCEERDLGDVLPRSLDEAVDQRDAEKVAIFSAFSIGQLSPDEEALTAQVLRDESLHFRLQMEWKRWEEPQQGQWDGNLPSLSSHIVKHLQAKRVRVTALEDYGHCPYRFFARHILGLQRPQEITYTVDRRIVGILWHKIMEKFLQQWQLQGNLPDEKTLRDIAEDVVNCELKNYPDMARELVCQQVLAAVEKVYSAERSELQKGWHPIGVEVELQFEASRLGEVPEPLKQVVISLKIDRIDESAKKQLRIADYKTGGAPSYTGIENGVALQLPLYALAVQVSDELACKPVVEALFLKLLEFTQKGVYSTACRLVEQQRGRQLKEMQQIAINWARQFLKSIAAADFTVRPFRLDSSCRGCDFKAMCRQNKLRLTERGQMTSSGENLE